MFNSVWRVIMGPVFDFGRRHTVERRQTVRPTSATGSLWTVPTQR